MTKPKTKSEVEYLRGIVRELRSENKHLKKMVSRGNKELSRLETQVTESEDEDDQDTSITVHDPKTACPVCGKGEMIKTDIGVKWLFTYSDCKHRRTEKK